ncbi:unnamed protein product [Schistosoma margrebowiei]|uniref:Uncharacterized protein n=1 Tax=Schistosoma margrebowiei TaxID=48269 RepID=A0A183LB16_9TREM|nr:unnamed protein product [Schistosoma margrebowiei]
MDYDLIPDTSGVLMNLENSQHTDSAIHTLVSNNNTTTPGVNTTNVGNDDADVTMCICPVCGFSASSPRRQDEHMELVHGDVTVSNILTTSNLTSITPPTSTMITMNQENSDSPKSSIKSMKLDWPLEMNNSTSFDFFQSHQPTMNLQQQNYHSYNSFTLQASSTPQRVKFWSTEPEQINSSLTTTTEQMLKNQKLDTVYSKNHSNCCLTTTTTTNTNTNSVGGTIDKFKLISTNTGINPGTTSTTYTIATITTTCSNNSSSSTSPSTAEIHSKFKTSKMTNSNNNEIKKSEKSRSYSSSLKNGKSKEKQKCFSLSSSSTLSLSTSSSPSSLLSVTTSPSSITTITTTTGTGTATKVITVGDDDDDHHHPVVKKVDSRRRYRYVIRSSLTYVFSTYCTGYKCVLLFA